MESKMNKLILFAFSKSPKFIQALLGTLQFDVWQHVTIVVLMPFIVVLLTHVAWQEYDDDTLIPKVFTFDVYCEEKTYFNFL